MTYMNSIDDLAKRLQPHYQHFNVGNRLMFTGHSHQAWPDVAAEGLEESYKAAASEVDNKWDTAFEKAEMLRGYLRNFYDDPDGLYCLAENTHLLLVSWLSSFDLKNKPKVITTDAEFHSMSRQLHRLGEEGLEITTVDGESDQIVKEIDNHADQRTAAIMLSRVYFKSGLINQYIPQIAEIARSYNIPLLVDDYHGTNVVPLSLRETGIEDCFLLIGGYKYLQWGEGNCFLRFPPDCRLRPVITGWFASFNTLDEPRNKGKPVHYNSGNQRFASSTYDSASQFRAAKVVTFFEDQKLTPSILRRQYLSQIKLMKELFLKQDLHTSIIKLRHNRPLEQTGGFLSLQSPFARTISEKLLEQQVYTDARGGVLRMGPAPYITTSQIEQAIEKLAKVVRHLKS